MNRLDVLSRQLTAGKLPEAPGQGKDRKSWIASKAEYERMYKWSVEDPQGFWAAHASDFYWQTKWVDNHMSANLDVRKGNVKFEWFKGAKTNISYNCLDRWVVAGRGDVPCFLWEGNEASQTRVMTYEQVMSETCRVANWLKLQGVKKGDAVTIYMAQTPELPIAMLACVRIGAVHSVVFGGFSAESLASRIVDCKGDVLITHSGIGRGPKVLGLKAIVDDACQRAALSGHTVKRVLVVEDASLPRKDCPWIAGRDVWWGDEVPRSSHYCAPEWLDSEDRSFLLYTSGSTGKPKGVVHTTGGYMVGAAITSRYYFDLQPGDVYFCTADCGWITGHSYVAYGPMLNGATSVLFGGVPTYPDASRMWQLCDKYKPRVLYTAPTLIRGLLQQGDKYVEGFDLSSLAILGSVGEPINEHAWNWFREKAGKGRVPYIVDTWWQTETGAHMISPFPGGWCAPKPSCAQIPFFGIQPVVLNAEGKEITETACEGILAMKAPWPSMARTLHGDHDRFEATYYAPFPGYYFTGDGCRRDEDGHIWITGRVDDVINVSGHRVGTAEVESALTEHPMCAEAAVIGVDHAVKGQSIYAYVTMKGNAKQDDAMRNALRDHVRKVIGSFAAPDVIHWAPVLPKTRSGKIMRRVLRKIAMRQEHELGDISTLAEPTVVSTLINLRGV